MSNVIQFPSRKKEEQSAPAPKVSVNTPKPTGPTKPVAKQGGVSAKVIGSSVLAILLATVAVNRYVYSQNETGAVEMASNGSPSRKIASVDSYVRDAAWEKSLAESLASTTERGLASAQVGRPATLEEKLRWGALEEKYTITYRTDVREINSIAFQDASGTPAYILDRSKFLSEYAVLFNASSTQLKSVEESSDKTIESYTLFDQKSHAKGEARFELDRHKRLISLKVEPIQI